MLQNPQNFIFFRVTETGQTHRLSVLLQGKENFTHLKQTEALAAVDLGVFCLSQDQEFLSQHNILCKCMQLKFQPPSSNPVLEHKLNGTKSLGINKIKSVIRTDI